MLSPGGARLATPKSRALTSESWTNSSKRSASKPDRVKHPATLPDRRASSAPATCAGKSRRHSARRRRGSARRFATDSPLEGDGFEPSVPRRKREVCSERKRFQPVRASLVKSTESYHRAGIPRAAVSWEPGRVPLSEGRWRRPQDHLTDAPAAQAAKHVFGSERLLASGSSRRKW